jgi:hypothetical protein
MGCFAGDCAVTQRLKVNADRKIARDPEALKEKRI